MVTTISMSVDPLVMCGENRSVIMYYIRLPTMTVLLQKRSSWS